MSQYFCFHWMTAVVSWVPPVHQYFSTFKRTYNTQRQRKPVKYFTFINIKQNSKEWNGVLILRVDWVLQSLWFLLVDTVWLSPVACSDLRQCMQGNRVLNIFLSEPRYNRLLAQGPVCGLLQVDEAKGRWHRTPIDWINKGENWKVRYSGVGQDPGFSCTFQIPA